MVLNRDVGGNAGRCFNTPHVCLEI